jgi:hypothetical protein
MAAAVRSSIFLTACLSLYHGERNGELIWSDCFGACRFFFFP